MWARYPQLIHLEAGRYVEPFVGAGAIFFALRPKEALLTDLNAALIETYEAIRDDWKEVWRRLIVHQRDHLLMDGYYYKVRESRPRSDAGKAAKFIYLNRTCFNGLYRVNLRGEFNVPKGTKDTVIFDNDNFHSTSQILGRAEIRTADFEEVIDQCGENDYIFADPPYTVQHNSNGFIKYNEKIFSWKDQVRLASAIARFSERGGKALVTNAAHSSLIDLYKKIGDVWVVNRHSVLASDVSHRAGVDEIAVTVGYSPRVQR